MIHYVNIRTGSRNEMVDITEKIQAVVENSGVKDGICYLYVPHTTAAVTINEGADPSVKRDILNTLQKLIPADAGYAHMEGNADSHVKSTTVGPSQIVFIEDGRLLLGTWQAIFFCEFDGPRHRRVAVKIVGQ
ncbi:MAG TPA: YjbQ family protein [Nitrospirae bacterium]|nr:YjbQ family protein [Nitrospirota bacterium]